MSGGWQEEGRQREREKQADFQLIREPEVGLDPKTSGSRPGPKEGAKPLSHPGIPLFHVKFMLPLILAK